MSLNLRELLAEEVLVLDGAMGTRLYELGIHLGQCFDALSLSDPDLVLRVHQEYREAGSQVLLTNSFGANRYKLQRHHIPEQTDKINQAAAHLARSVAGEGLLVAGSMGPLGVKIEPWGPTALGEAREAFAEQAAALAAGGVDLLVLETFSDPRELAEGIHGARQGAPDLPVVASMTVGEDLNSLYGAGLLDFLPYLVKAGPDAIGLNCSVGPKLMLEALEIMVGCTRLPLCIQPDAGFPKRLEERYIYLSSPDYFGRYGQRLVEAGARMVGGCCGTTPEHIRALSRAVRAVQPRRPMKICPPRPEQRPEIQATPMEAKSQLGAKIAGGHFVACVEVLPPRGWGLRKLLGLASELSQAGFDTVNLPDGPRASARLSPLATAVKIQDAVQTETVLHYVCRDRNLLGMQADLLGAYTLGLRNLLLVTGDPPAKGDYPDATAVFDVDSIGLTNLVRRLNHGVDVGERSIGRPTSFLIGVGANPTALSFEKEVERFYWKVDAGAEFAVTQPVFDIQALERFLDAVRDFTIPILAGIWPLQSLRNAEFLHHEVPGVTVPEEVMERMRAAGSPEAEREEGMRIALEMARQVLPRVVGLQISAPFNRGEVAKRMLVELRSEIGEIRRKGE